jgi:hypothetical protein
MWEPRRLTTLWAFTACYRDSFTYSCQPSITSPLSLSGQSILLVYWLVFNTCNTDPTDTNANSCTDFVVRLPIILREAVRAKSLLHTLHEDQTRSKTSTNSKVVIARSPIILFSFSVLFLQTRCVCLPRDPQDSNLWRNCQNRRPLIDRNVGSCHSSTFRL